MRENINFTKQKILFPIHQDLSLWCKIVQLWWKYLFLERWTGDQSLKVSMGHKTKQNTRTKQNKIFLGKDGNGLKVSLGQLADLKFVATVATDSSCVNFSRKQRIPLQNLCRNMKFTNLFGKFLYTFSSKLLNFTHSFQI